MDRATLFLCGSQKPAPGHSDRSACRELLRVVLEGFKSQNTPHRWLDLREIALPSYDGRFASAYGHVALNELMAAIAECSLIVVSVPAYWGAAAGGIKNALDLIGGPLYDNPEGLTPLSGKRVAQVVVGATDRDAHLAAVQMRTSFLLMGASVHDGEILVGNLRQSTALYRQALIARLHRFGAQLAIHSQRLAAVQQEAGQ